MATVLPDRLRSEKLISHDDVEDVGATEKGPGEASIAPLGKPLEERKFWFQRIKNYDPYAIATQVCIYGT
jgi:hypothetical protein